MIPLDIIHTVSSNLGFDACGVCEAKAFHSERDQLLHWLHKGMHADMGYMERNLEKRIDPTLLVPGAKSVISVLLSYYPGNPTIATQPPKISRYALCTDYHTVIKQMLWQMLELLRKECGPVNGRAFVDSAPVLERAWAQNAGLGWIGKNGLLIHPKLGTYTFIGELIVDIEIEPSNSTVTNRCGTCTRCMDACPTGAIVKPGVVDARRCISYLTIEKKTALSEQERQSLNGWCFGCDICQEVCPWNGKLETTKCQGLQPKAEILGLNAQSILNLSNEDFHNIFGETPVSRAGYEHFMLNCKSNINR